jgi:hypothetical protein
MQANTPLFILTVKNTHTETTYGEFTTGLQSRGATVEFKPSRLGDFDVVRVNRQPVARAFKSRAGLLAYMAERP